MSGTIRLLVHTPTRIDEPKPLQLEGIITQRTMSDGRINLSANIRELMLSSSSKNLQNLALAVREIMTKPKWRYISACHEPDTHGSGNFQEPRFGLASAGTIQLFL